jgi:hypothetical protein
MEDQGRLGGNLTMSEGDTWKEGLETSLGTSLKEM